MFTIYGAVIVFIKICKFATEVVVILMPLFQKNVIISMQGTLNKEMSIAPNPVFSRLKG